MNELMTMIEDIYVPEKALMIYRTKSGSKYYVESFDLDEDGCALNAHPLSLLESAKLACVLDSSSDLQQTFLTCRSMMPDEVLHINSNSRNGHVIWFSPACRTALFFKDDLGIPDGIANVPPLIWKASRNTLHVWTVVDDVKPSPDTPLYHAPFFNLHDSGKVCMGNVKVEFDSNCFLEDFMLKWQGYFFSSTFSHLIMDHAPCKQNIVQLWKTLIGSKKTFPKKTLLKTSKTLKSILS